jgi:hypothetical protein
MAFDVSGQQTKTPQSLAACCKESIQTRYLLAVGTVLAV